MELSGNVKVVNNVISPRLCEQIVYKLEKDYLFIPSECDGQIDLNYKDSLEIKVKDKNLTNDVWNCVKEYVPFKQNLVEDSQKEMYCLKFCEDQFYKSSPNKQNKQKLSVLVCISNNAGTITFGDKYGIEPMMGTVLMFPTSTPYVIKKGTIDYGYYLCFDLFYEEIKTVQPYKNQSKVHKINKDDDVTTNTSYEMFKY